MGQLIYDLAGGLKFGRTLKAIIPGGSSAKVLRADERFKIKQKQPDGSMVEQELAIDEIPLDFDSLAAAGSMAGSGGVIVLDDSRDMVWTLNNINEFYAHESCGQCTPCREGSLWMKKITDRMLLGGGVTEDPRTLKTVPITLPAGPSALSVKPARGRRKASSTSSRRNSPRGRSRHLHPPFHPS